MIDSMGVSRPMPWAFFATLGLVFALIIPASASAQSGSSGDPKVYGPTQSSWTGSDTVKKSSDEAWKTAIWTGVEYQGKTDLKDTTGKSDFSYFMVSAGATTARMFGDSLKVALKADYRFIDYSFAGVQSDPWETINVFRLNPLFTYHFNETWSLIGGPIVEFTGEDKADFGDSLRGGGLIGFGYTRDNLVLAAGVIAMTEIEKDARIQPFLLVNWHITEDLKFGVKADTSRGGEFRLGYAFTDKFNLGVGIGMRRELFRLNGDRRQAIPGIAPAPGRADGVGEETATVAKLTATYQITEMMAIEGYGGVTIDGEFRLEDKDGDKIASSDYDDSGFGGINLRFKF